MSKVSFYSVSTWKVLIAALLFLILRIKIPLEGKDSCELLLYPIIWVKNYKETTSGRWMCCSAGLPIQSSLLMYPPYGNAAGCHLSLKYCRCHVQNWSTGQGRGLCEIHPTKLLIRKLYFPCLWDWNCIADFRRFVLKEKLWRIKKMLTINI